MKKIFDSIRFMAITLMACMSLSSCGSDDNDEPKVVEYNIVGKWGMENIDWVEPKTPSMEVAYGLTIPFIEFEKGGGMNFREWDFELAEPKPAVLTGSYSIKGDQLTISTSSNAYLNGTYTIEKATKDKLILYRKTSTYSARLQLGASLYNF